MTRTASCSAVSMRPTTARRASPEEPSAVNGRRRHARTSLDRPSRKSHRRSTTRCAPPSQTPTTAPACMRAPSPSPAASCVSPRASSPSPLLPGSTRSDQIPGGTSTTGTCLWVASASGWVDATDANSTSPGRPAASRLRRPSASLAIHSVRDAASKNAADHGPCRADNTATTPAPPDAAAAALRRCGGDPSTLRYAAARALSLQPSVCALCHVSCVCMARSPLA